MMAPTHDKNRGNELVGLVIFALIFATILKDILPDLATQISIGLGTSKTAQADAALMGTALAAMIGIGLTSWSFAQRQIDRQTALISIVAGVALCGWAILKASADDGEAFQPSEVSGPLYLFLVAAAIFLQGHYLRPEGGPVVTYARPVLVGLIGLIIGLAYQWTWEHFVSEMAWFRRHGHLITPASIVAMAAAWGTILFRSPRQSAKPAILLLCTGAALGWIYGAFVYDNLWVHVDGPGRWWAGRISFYLTIPSVFAAILFAQQLDRSSPTIAHGAFWLAIASGVIVATALACAADMGNTADVLNASMQLQQQYLLAIICLPALTCLAIWIGVRLSETIWPSNS